MRLEKRVLKAEEEHNEDTKGYVLSSSILTWYLREHMGYKIRNKMNSRKTFLNLI